MTSPSNSPLRLPTRYRGLLAPILPVAARPGERLSQAAARMDQAQTLEREIATLGWRLISDAQLTARSSYALSSDTEPQR